MIPQMLFRSGVRGVVLSQFGPLRAGSLVFRLHTWIALLGNGLIESLA